MDLQNFFSFFKLSFELFTYDRISLLKIKNSFIAYNTTSFFDFKHNKMTTYNPDSLQ